MMSKRLRILVVRFSSIGDIILTTPVVRCLKKQLEAEIHYLTKQSFRDVIASNPHIDHIHTIDSSVHEVVDTLRSLRFDLIVDLHHNLRTRQLRSALKVRSQAFAKLNVEKWLLVNLGIDRLPDVHIVHRYLETVAHLGVKYDGLGLDFPLASTNQNNASAPYVAIAIGAGLPTKALEPTQLARLIQLINYPVALLGGPGDQELGQSLAAASDTAENFAGKNSLPDSALVLNRSRLLITPDTGLMHMAAALNKPIISIWGNTIPKFGMTPFYADRSTAQHRAFEVHGLRCRPCSKIGFQVCPKTHFRCIRDIDLARIAALANTWMASSTADPVDDTTRTVD